MRPVIKSFQKPVRAWQLGQDSPMEQALIREGKIRHLSSGRYELFSREATTGTGELADAGDYFKVDSSGFPYPNSREFFEANHQPLGGDEYQQTPKVLHAWFLGDPMEEDIRFLQQHKGLQITPEQPQTCFRAPLWGSVLTASSDAALLIYGTSRSDTGEITDVDFNFVSREEFEKSYLLLAP